MSGMINVWRCVRIRQALQVSMVRNACKKNSMYNIKHTARDDGRRFLKQILAVLVVTRRTYVPSTKYTTFADLWNIGVSEFLVQIYENLDNVSMLTEIGAN